MSRKLAITLVGRAKLALLPLALLGVACSDAFTTDTDMPSTLVCPGGGLDVAEVSEATLPTCADVEQRYADLVSGFRACTVDADCQVVAGHCAVGIGGCHEVVSTCLDGAVLDEVSALWQVHSEGCMGGVCDCDVPPAIACVRGVCEAVP